MQKHRCRSPLYAVMATTIFLLLAACGGGNGASEPSSVSAREKTIDVEDNYGVQTVKVPPQRVVATDNRLFQTLADWKIKLVAAPVDLIPQDNPYKKDGSIVNLGNHREPTLEAVVSVQPDLILNGQRFGSRRGDFQKLVPEATLISLDPRKDQPLDAELKRQVNVLGRIFGRETDAQELTAGLDAAIARAKAAYDPSQKVMAVITSGGNINYTAPGAGRTLGPVFGLLGLTPALQANGSIGHQGDDISVEAIAASNPDWILVMDRDAAVGASRGASYQPANALIANSPALRNVAAVRHKRIVYLPANAYTNEGIQMYTAFFNALAEAFENHND